MCIPHRLFSEFGKNQCALSILRTWESNGVISRTLLVRYLKVPILLLSKMKWKRENWLQGDSIPILQIAFLFNFWGKMDSKKIGLHQHSQLRKQEVNFTNPHVSFAVSSDCSFTLFAVLSGMAHRPSREH